VDERCNTYRERRLDTMSYEPPLNDDVFELDDDYEELDDDVLDDLVDYDGEPDRMWGDD
jgi:hypothetical protein